MARSRSKFNTHGDIAECIDAYLSRTLDGIDTQFQHRLWV